MSGETEQHETFRPVWADGTPELYLIDRADHAEVERMKRDGRLVPLPDGQWRMRLPRAQTVGLLLNGLQGVRRARLTEAGAGCLIRASRG